MFSFGSAQFAVFQEIELMNRTGDVQYVEASFQKVVQIHEKSVGRELPETLGLELVLEISLFELSTNINGQL